MENALPCVFTKFGDGETICAFYGASGCNCDGTSYSAELAQKLRDAYSHLATLAGENNNVFVGLWPFNPDFQRPWTALADSRNIQAAAYDALICRGDFVEDRRKAALYRSIKQSTQLKKIIVCNPFLVKSKILLGVDDHCCVDVHNWVRDQYARVLADVAGKISCYRQDRPVPGHEKRAQVMVLTCCGMGAKALISDLSSAFPNEIYLDFGSALDLACTKRDSRGREYDYAYIYDLLCECDVLSPQDQVLWHDPQFEDLYRGAKKHIGIHMPP